VKERLRSILRKMEVSDIKDLSSFEKVEFES
jgi:hypothetical protein